jgi:aspartyl protease family protein
MTDGNGPFALYYLIVAVAVASSLFAMRLPLGKVLKMVLAWVAIFGVGFILFSFRSEFSSFGQRLRAEATGTSIADGQTVRIPIADDGHFWVDATVNGRPLRFVVDSGATITTVSAEAAKAVRIPIGTERTVINTANGRSQVIKGWADRLEVGSIERTDFPVDINEHDDTNLLGMNFLSSLRSWRVEGNYLVLEP